MQRRKFLYGVGASAIGGSALVGSGAFSRVESQRDVSIQVAQDPDAYLGLVPMDTPNSDNYVGLDEYGHLEIDIADQTEGEGVNSNSTTWFDGLFKIVNQGKDEITNLCFGMQQEDFEALDNVNVWVYTYDCDDEDRNLGGDDEEYVEHKFHVVGGGGHGRACHDDWPDLYPGATDDWSLEVGEELCVGLKVETKDVNAYGDDDESPSTLVDGTLTIEVDAPGAGEPGE